MKLDSKQLKSIAILYVEDDDIVRDQTTKILKKLFKKVYIGIDGKNGLELYIKHINNIDIVITDINMPKINGLDMISEINNLNKSIPTIVTTAHSDAKNLLKAIDINIDKYITKPIQIKELTLTIVDLVLKYKRSNNIENLAKSLVHKTTQNDKENCELNTELEMMTNQKIYLDSIVDNMVLNFKIDKSGTIIKVSNKFKVFFDYKNIVGKNINILKCQSCNQESFQKLMLKAIHTKKMVMSTSTLITNYDRKVDVEVTMTPSYGVDALVNGYLVYLDII
jgi:response regulator RpfG family c-di-GMP phosphodiesterase